jgi:hypothetical protein
VAATASIAFTTKSTGMMSEMPSGIPGNSGSVPRPYARMIGSAILKPSIHPGYGWAYADSMIDGRTIDSGRSCSVASSSTARSPIAFVNV